MSKKDDYNPSVNYGKLNDDTTWEHTPDPNDPKYYRSMSERFTEDTSTSQKIGIAVGIGVLLAGLKFVTSRKPKVSPTQMKILSNLAEQRRWNYGLRNVDAVAQRQARAGLLIDDLVTAGCAEVTEKGRKVLRQKR